MQLSAKRNVTVAVSACAALLVGGGVAHGYATAVHADFYELAFGDRSRKIATPSTDQLVSFRTFVWEKASKNPEFLKRWPTAASFDAAAFKEFLALSPGKTVVGVDIAPADAGKTELELGRYGSVSPDDDRRNQDRLFIENGKVVLDAFGRAVPYDPRTTWFGGLTGVPSQFDAHGALLREGISSSYFTAFLHPERYVPQGVSLGSAPEFSEVYTDLAMVARLRGRPGDDWLSVSFGANNMHGIEDLGNQIHCTLIGDSRFFTDALITHTKNKLSGVGSKLLGLLHLGPKAPPKVAPIAHAHADLTSHDVSEAVLKCEEGKCAEVDPAVLYAIGKDQGGEPTLQDVGLIIIANHHRLLEDYFQREYQEGLANLKAGKPCRPEVKMVQDRAKAGDKAFRKQCLDAMAKEGYGLTNRPGETEFARIIAEVMVKNSAPEASPIYRAIRALAKPELRRGGVYMADAPGAEPRDQMIIARGARTPETDTIFEYHAKAFARVVEALRLWEDLIKSETKDAPGTPEADATIQRVVHRLVVKQLAYMDAAKARRDTYIAEQAKKAVEASKPSWTSGFKKLLGKIVQ